MFSIIQALMIYGMIIVGDPMSATGHFGTACVGAPDEATKANGRKLGACQIAGLELLRLNFQGKSQDPTHVGSVVVAKRWLLAGPTNCT